MGVAAASTSCGSLQPTSMAAAVAQDPAARSSRRGPSHPSMDRLAVVGDQVEALARQPASADVVQRTEYRQLTPDRVRA